MQNVDTHLKENISVPRREEKRREQNRTPSVFSKNSLNKIIVAHQVPPQFSQLALFHGSPQCAMSQNYKIIMNLHKLS
jgi:hypothetical protein